MPMKNLWLSIVVSILFNTFSSLHAQPLKCDLYFFSSSEVVTDSRKEELAPKMKEYPISIRIHYSQEHPKGLPLDELKSRLHLIVAEHVSWVIPSFSQKMFFSLFKENVCPTASTEEEEDFVLLDRLLEDELPSPEHSSPSLCVIKKTIGTMEIFSQSKKAIKGTLTFFDPPYHLTVQQDFPIEKWIIIDSPKEVAILYISRL